MKEPTAPQKRKCNTAEEPARNTTRRIVLPLNSEQYEEQMQCAKRAKKCIELQMGENPELFPQEMAEGYKLHGWTEPSKKMEGRRFRRIRMQQGERLAYTIMPCDILPYLTGMVSEVEKALFLKSFGVPDWALTYVFGRNDSYWYRLQQTMGRNNIVGTTVKDATQIPKNLLADEKHCKAHGEKWYIATTVAADCVLGAAVTTAADTTQLEVGYGVFKQEAQQLNPDYQPDSVNTDGWAATRNAWQQLFPKITVLLCFLHAFIKIRSCCKRLGTRYDQLKQQLWTIYHAADRAEFYAEVCNLQQWLNNHYAHLTTSAIDAIDKLCQRADQFCLAYNHPHAYRTSNMLDRHMEPMARWLFNGRFFHGNRLSADLRTRGWALIHNYRPYCPRAKISDSFRSPAHKLNGSTYRDNWLENLLVSTSCQGFQHRHRKRQN